MAADGKKDAEQILKELCEKQAQENGKYYEDVKHVYESVQKGTFSKRDWLCGALWEYLEQNETKEGKKSVPGRNITWADGDNEANFLRMNQVLSLANAPLGKWPTKTAFTVWPQVELNLVTGKGTEEVFEDTGKLIAATERTESEKAGILKELLADTVVERAALLAKYDKPDEMFESFNFYHGEENNHAYAEYPAKWHRIRDERLTEQSMVLASNEVKSLDKLCADLSKKEKTLGLLAYDLSSDAQRKAFYEKTLEPMIAQFRKADLAAERLPKYQKAREAFLAQYELVRDQQEKLGALQQSLLKNWKEEKQRSKNLKEAEAAIDHAKKDAETAEANRKPLYEQRDRLVADLEELEKDIEETGAAAQRAKNEWNQYNETIRTGFDKETELRNSVSGLAKLFSKKKYEAAMEQADQFQKAAIEAQEKAPAAEKKMKELSAKYGQLEEVRVKLQRDLENVSDRLTQLGKTINQSNAMITRRQEDAEQVRHALEAVEKERKEILGQWEKEEGSHRRTLLDVAYVTNLFSQDEKISDPCKAENPWFTQHYQKEREKLFTLAMEMNRAFVEASECCMANLATLAQYWGLWKKNGEAIKFHEADCADTVPTLWQTLFLFLPVTGMELASVAELFRDVRKPGQIGALAIDKAADKGPEAIIGATYRSRRAIAFA